MENEDDLKVEEVLSSSACFSAQSSSKDCSEQSESSLDETSDSCVDTCNKWTKKEFEYNQFFILAETSSLPKKNSLNFLEQSESSEVASNSEHNENHTNSAQALVKAEDCEVFHGILESEDFVIVPAGRDLESCGNMNNGYDVFPRSSDELDGVDCIDIDQKRSDEIDDVNKPTSKSATISVAQSFLNDIKTNSETRSKILEEVSSSSSVDIKADTTNLKTELELIEKLDMKIQQLESVEPSTCSSRYQLSSEGSKGIPSAVLYLREEKKRWKRQLLLKRALQKLDMVQCRNSNKHILRNFLLGPRARYFSLTKEEEDVVEEILSRPDFVDDETSEGNSTTSSISTAFDLEGEDALRMAEIDERLEQFIEIHSQCGSPSLTSVTLSVQKQQSVCSQNSNGAMRTPSLECNASAENERPRSFATSVEDYLSEKKESRKHQEKVESIDKRLRELIIGEIPSRLPKEQLDMLISQCMMEQNLEVTMRPFLCLKT